MSIEGFVYCWHDKKTGMKYLGRHKGSLTDGYIGSGSNFRAQYNVRPEDFTREILWHSTETTPKQLISEEKKRIDAIPKENMFYGSDPKYYNGTRAAATGGEIFGDLMKHPDAIAKMKATREAIGLNDPYRNSIAKYGEDGISRMRSSMMQGNTRAAGNKGKPKSAEHRRKLSEAAKKHYAKISR